MKTTLKPNALKINFNEDEFVVSFAESDDSKNIKNEVDIKISPDQVMSVIVPMFSSLIEYQERYGVDLGIDKKEE